MIPKNSNKLVVGICGGSAAGKSTFARALCERLGEEHCVVVPQDAYFSDFSEYGPEIRETMRTHNHPRAVKWDTLRADIESLRNYAPQAVIIVEGHLIFWEPQIRALFDVLLFVEADAHERVLRRIERTMRAPNADLDAAIEWYRRDVLPNYPVHTEATRAFADLIVPWNRYNEQAVDLVEAAIRCRVDLS